MNDNAQSLEVILIVHYSSHNVNDNAQSHDVNVDSHEHDLNVGSHNHDVYFLSW